MESLKKLIYSSQIRTNIIGEIGISSPQLTFQYSSSNLKVQKSLKNIIIKIIELDNSYQLRLMINHPELTKLLKTNKHQLNLLNINLPIGHLIYSINRDIIYFKYTLQLSITTQSLNSFFTEVLSKCIDTFEVLLLKLWELHTTGTLLHKLKNFKPLIEACPDCGENYSSCACEDALITNECEIQNSVEIIKELQSSEDLVEFFDFSEFFDDELCSYTYDPGYVLINKLKSYPLSSQFVEKFFRMLESFAARLWFFKKFPGELMMVSVLHQEICDFKLALVFDKPHKFKRLFTNIYSDEYTDEMRISLANIILIATNSNIAVEDYYSLEAFKVKELDNVSELIASGKFSKIYKNTLLQRKVAIKVPRNKKTAKDRVLNAFSKLKVIKNKNVIDALGLVMYKNTPCIVMPYYETVKVPNSPQSSESSPLEIMKSVAMGLACTHKHKFIHQDLKPSNVLLANNKKVKIIDFGLATKEGQTLPFSGFNALYSDPDQLIMKSPGTKADIWSFGMLFYNELFKVNPFTDPYFAKKFDAQRIHYLLKVEGKRPEIPKEFWEEKRVLAQIMVDCWHQDALCRPDAFGIIRRLEIKYNMAWQVLKTGEIMGTLFEKFVSECLSKNEEFVVDFELISEIPYFKAIVIKEEQKKEAKKKRLGREEFWTRYNEKIEEYFNYCTRIQRGFVEKRKFRGVSYVESSQTPSLEIGIYKKKFVYLKKISSNKNDLIYILDSNREIKYHKEFEFFIDFSKFILELRGWTKVKGYYYYVYEYLDTSLEYYIKSSSLDYQQFLDLANEILLRAFKLVVRQATFSSSILIRDAKPVFIIDSENSLGTVFCLKTAFIHFKYIQNERIDRIVESVIFNLGELKDLDEETIKKTLENLNQQSLQI